MSFVHTKLLRFYSITSLAGILVAATLLTMLYRSVAIGEIVEFAQRSNLALAQIALGSVKTDLADYLGKVGNARPQELTGENQFPPLIIAKFATLMLDTSVVRIKVYNKQGVVVFSTRADQIGGVEESNEGVALALKGKVSSNLIYRDTFNQFEKETEEDNVISTYVPVRNSPLEPVQGVFEIYTDVDALVKQNEWALITIMAGVGLILILLYAGLILVVRRATGIIESQQNIIHERTAALESLSAQMLKSEEMEKKKLAAVLHEGLAQTLSAIKTHLEHSREQSVARNRNAGPRELLIPALQDAINDVRTIATDLRPASLDELGLLPTIHWFCREFGRLHPEIRVGQEISLQEDEVPGHLKIVVYRILEAALKRIAHFDSTEQVLISLRLVDQSVVLKIDDTPREATSGVAAKPRAGADRKVGLVEISERTTLSGGSFSVTPNTVGGATFRASWAISRQSSLNKARN